MGGMQCGLPLEYLRHIESMPDNGNDGLVDEIRNPGELRTSQLVDLRFRSQILEILGTFDFSFLSITSTSSSA
jgi:hypothetical protein